MNRSSTGPRLRLVPTTISDAQAFVEQHHRHHGPAHSYLFAVACADEERVRGVAIIGRPVARMLQDGWTAEVVRLCTDGAANACSMLYGAAWRAARALGYLKLVTYTLAEEGGQLACQRMAPDRRGWRRFVVARLAAPRRPPPDAREVAMGEDMRQGEEKLRWERT